MALFSKKRDAPPAPAPDDVAPPGAVSTAPAPAAPPSAPPAAAQQTQQRPAAPAPPAPAQQQSQPPAPPREEAQPPAPPRQEAQPPAPPRQEAQPPAPPQEAQPTAPPQAQQRQAPPLPKLEERQVEQSASGSSAAEPAQKQKPATAEKQPEADEKAEKPAEKPEKKPEKKAEKKAEKKPAEAEDEKPKRDRNIGASLKLGSDVVRSRIASIVWLVAVLCAVVLAVGALMVALKANRDNAVVDAVKGLAHVVDLGVFSPSNGLFKPKNDPDLIKAALINWGIAAVLYLVVGRILDRIIRP